MGGGTALAMRWGHRLSTDVDLAVDIAAFTRMNDERQPEISKALASLKESGEITKFGYRRHIIEIYFPTGPVSLVGSALSGSKATSDQAEFHTGVKLVKTEEIPAVQDCWPGVGAWQLTGSRWLRPSFSD